MLRQLGVIFSLNTNLLVFQGGSMLVFVVYPLVVCMIIAYEIWRGEALGVRRQARGASRKTDPAEFWRTIAFQLFILVVVFLLILFRLKLIG
jgi:hypothetical protein